jgi:threonine/homoserine/homoserine lactone efflux protein
MMSVIGEVLPLALVVTISPLNIVPAILLLFTTRPLANATRFLVGFTLGVGVVLGLFVAVTGAVNLSSDSGHSRWGAILKLVLGSYLLVAAVRKFRGRPPAGVPGDMPKWMDGMAGYGPAKSFGAGVTLGALNPKNLVVAVAAASTIATADLTSTQVAIVVMIYVAIAIGGVATPILVTLFLGDRAPQVLEGWNVWLRQNNATVMSVLFVVFGVVLIGQGVAAV